MVTCADIKRLFTGSAPKLGLTTRTIVCQDAPGTPLVVKTAGEPVGYLRTKAEAHAALMVIAGSLPGLPE